MALGGAGPHGPDVVALLLMDAEDERPGRERAVVCAGAQAGLLASGIWQTVVPDRPTLSVCCSPGGHLGALQEHPKGPWTAGR